MQRLKLLRAGRVDIAKREHVFEAILAPAFVTAASIELFWIFERAEEHVPNRQVGEIIGVMTKLMMDAMGFRSLKDEAEPRGSFDVPVVEEFSERNQERVIAGGLDAGAKQWVDNQTAEQRIDPDFHRMFVKAGHDFQSSCRMVDLMERAPEKLRFVPVAMPPVIDQGGENINDQRGQPVAAVVFEMKDRHVVEPAVPSLTGQDGDSKLDGVDQDDAAPPGVYARQLHRRP